MARLIDDEQKGFLVGRQIGDVIITIQAAQALLESRGDVACLICADFTKAYDTVDRDFLHSFSELKTGTLVKGTSLPWRTRPRHQGTYSKRGNTSGNVLQ